MLGQAIMKRSRIRNLANKTQNPIDIKNFKKQRNIVVKLNKTRSKWRPRRLHSKLPP